MEKVTKMAITSLTCTLMNIVLEHIFYEYILCILENKSVGVIIINYQTKNVWKLFSSKFFKGYETENYDD